MDLVPAASAWAAALQAPPPLVEVSAQAIIWDLEGAWALAAGSALAVGWVPAEVSALVEVSELITVPVEALAPEGALAPSLLDHGLEAEIGAVVEEDVIMTTVTPTVSTLVASGLMDSEAPRAAAWASLLATVSLAVLVYPMGAYCRACSLKMVLIIGQMAPTSLLLVLMDPKINI